MQVEVENRKDEIKEEECLTVRMRERKEEEKEKQDKRVRIWSAKNL